MKNLLILIAAILVMTTGCKKKDDPKPEGPKIVITVKFQDGSLVPINDGGTQITGHGVVGNTWYFNTNYDAKNCDVNGQTITYLKTTDDAVIINAHAYNSTTWVTYTSDSDTIIGPFTSGQIINRILIVK